VNNNINVAFCCDENYVPYLVPSIISIINSKNKNTSIAIFILETGINNYHKDNILKLQTDSVRINFINVAEQAKDLILSKVPHKTNFNSTILYKLLIPQIFNDSAKILLLDADIIVQKDLSELYNKNIGNYYIAAAKRKLPYHLKYFISKGKKYSVREFYSKVLGLPDYFYDSDAKYYMNAGVILFNISKILQDNKDKELIEVFFKHKDGLVYAEQDIFSKVFLDSIAPLLPNEHFVHVFYDKIRKEEYNKVLNEHKEAAIVHYIASKTYAKMLRSIYAKEYFDNLQKSYLQLSSLDIFLLKLKTIKKFIYKPKLWWAMPYVLGSIKINKK